MQVTEFQHAQSRYSCWEVNVKTSYLLLHPTAHRSLSIRPTSMLTMLQYR